MKNLAFNMINETTTWEWIVGEEKTIEIEVCGFTTTQTIKPIIGKKHKLTGKIFMNEKK